MHEIRLRRAWSKRVDGEALVGRVQVPDAISPMPAEPPSGVEYRRSFNRPTDLGANRVFLWVSGWQGKLTTLRLNGTDLPVAADVTGHQVTGLQVEITSLLNLHNELIVQLAAQMRAVPLLTGEVSLQIEER